MHLLELLRRTLQHYSPVESQKMFLWTAKLYLTLHRHDVCVCVCDPLIVTAAPEGPGLENVAATDSAQ